MAHEGVARSRASGLRDGVWVQKAGKQTAPARWAVHRGAPPKAQVPSPQPKNTAEHLALRYFFDKARARSASWSRHKRANAEGRGPRKKAKVYLRERRCERAYNEENLKEILKKSCLQRFLRKRSDRYCSGGLLRREAHAKYALSRRGAFHAYKKYYCK